MFYMHMRTEPVAKPHFMPARRLTGFVSMAYLTALSIIGEYLGCIDLGTKCRPLFIIDKVERAVRK
jgi:hypothetical protein